MPFSIEEIENFKLISKKDVAAQVQSFCKEYKIGSDQQIANNTRIQEQLEKLLKGQGVSVNWFKDITYNSKYAAQLLRLDGVLVHRQSLNISPIKEHKDSAIYWHLIKNSELTQLAGWEQEIYLTIHLFYLFHVYARIDKDLEKPLPTDKGVLKSILIEEIWVALNGLYIRNLYRRVSEAKEVEKGRKEEHLRYVGQKLLQSMEAMVPELEEGDEIVVPCGFDKHAMYLYFVYFAYKGKQEVWLRLDNVGAGAEQYASKYDLKDKNHPGKLRPAVITIHENKTAKLSENVGILDYLQAVFLAKAKSETEALPDLYNEGDRFNIKLLDDRKKENTYELLPEQKGSNCVVESFRVGMTYRLEGLAQEVREWFTLSEVQFAYENHHTLDTLGAVKRVVCKRKEKIESLSKKDEKEPKAEKKDSVVLSIPASTSSFIPRENIVTKVLDLLGEIPESEQKIIVLNGPPGIGKTEVAKQVAREFIKKEDNNEAFWIESDNVDDIIDSYKKLARYFGLNEDIIKANLVETCQFVKDKINRKNYMLIFNNLNNKENLEYKINSRVVYLLPDSDKIKILITCRGNEWPPSQTYTVKPFTRAQSTECLKKLIKSNLEFNPFAKELKDEILDSIADCLYDYPLALRIVGYNIHKFNPTKFDSIRKKLRIGNIKNRDQYAITTVNAAWQFMIDVTMQECQEAYDFLRMCSLLSPFKINVDLFFSISDAQEYIEDLRQRFVIDVIDKKYFTLHPFVRDIILEGVEKEKEQSRIFEIYLKKLLNLLNTHSKEDNLDDIRSHVELVLAFSKRFKVLNLDYFELLRKLVSYHIHVVRALDKAKLEMKELETNKEFKQNLTRTYFDMGYLHSHTGHLTEAIEYFEKSIKENNNKDLLYLARALTGMCVTNLELNYLEKCEGLLKDAEKYLNLIPDQDREEVKRAHALLYSAFGWVYYYHNNYKESLKYFDKCLDQNIPSQKICAYNGKGYVYKDSGDYKEAKASFLESKKIVVTGYYQSHCDWLEAINGLGWAHTEFSEYKEAEENFNKVLEAYNRKDPLFKPMPSLLDTYTGIALMNIIKAIQKKGDTINFEEELNNAKNYLEKSSQLIESFFDKPQNNPYYGDFYYTKGYYFYLKKDKENANEFFNKAEFVYKKMGFTETHPKIISIRNFLKEMSPSYINDSSISDSNSENLSMEVEKELEAKKDKSRKMDKLSSLAQEKMKKKNAKQYKTIQRCLATLGDDRTLATHGRSRTYLYQCMDTPALLEQLRHEKLIYHKGNGLEEYKKPGGEAYSAYRENAAHIFISEAYVNMPHQGVTFADCLKEDIGVITGTHTISTRCHRWQHMPQTLLLLFLQHSHWRVVRVKIDYQKSIFSVLWDDPFGADFFPSTLRASLLEALYIQVGRLIKENEPLVLQPKTKESKISIDDSKITSADHVKYLQQQPHGLNGFDCGPICLQNMRDYVEKNDLTNEVFAQTNTQFYTVPKSDAPMWEDILQSRRVQDCAIYIQFNTTSTFQAPYSENQKRLQQQQAALKQARAEQAKQLQQVLTTSHLEALITVWEPYWSEMFFAMFENQILLNSSLDSEQHGASVALEKIYQLVETQRSLSIIVDQKKRVGAPNKEKNGNTTQTQKTKELPEIQKSGQTEKDQYKLDVEEAITYRSDTSITNTKDSPESLGATEKDSNVPVKKSKKRKRQVEVIEGAPNSQQGPPKPPPGSNGSPPGPGYSTNSSSFSSNFSSSNNNSSNSNSHTSQRVSSSQGKQQTLGELRLESQAEEKGWLGLEEAIQLSLQDLKSQLSQSKNNSKRQHALNKKLTPYELLEKIDKDCQIIMKLEEQYISTESKLHSGDLLSKRTFFTVAEKQKVLDGARRKLKSFQAPLESVRAGLMNKLMQLPLEKLEIQRKALSSPDASLSKWERIKLSSLKKAINKKQQPSHDKVKETEAILDEAKLKEIRIADAYKELAKPRNRVNKLAQAVVENRYPNAQELKAFSRIKGLHLGAAFSEGDCFFDAFGEALKEMKKDPTDMQALRVICSQYIEEQNKLKPGDEKCWVEQYISEEIRLRPIGYMDYAGALQLTQSQVWEAVVKNEGLDAGVSLWGNPSLEGRILCKHFKVKLHIMGIGDDGRIDHALVTETEERPLEVNDEALNDPIVIHIAVYKNHFMPLLRDPLQQADVAEVDYEFIQALVHNPDNPLIWMSDVDKSNKPSMKTTGTEKKEEKDKPKTLSQRNRGKDFIEDSDNQPSSGNEDPLSKLPAGVQTAKEESQTPAQDSSVQLNDSSKKSKSNSASELVTDNPEVVIQRSPSTMNKQIDSYALTLSRLTNEALITPIPKQRTSVFVPQKKTRKRLFDKIQRPVQSDSLRRSFAGAPHKKTVFPTTVSISTVTVSNESTVKPP